VLAASIKLTEKGRTIVATSNTMTNALVSFSAIILSSVISFAPALAQEHCKVDEVILAKNTTYTEQHVMDVGDVPGHQIRIFELKRTYPDDKPNCEGLKRTVSTGHLATDYINANGSLRGYTVVTYDNGDKMYIQSSGTSHTIMSADGTKTGSFVGVDQITGGTGKYLGARGLLRETVKFDAAKNYNESHQEGDYWIEK
jgi:hypothetical protein